MGNVQVRISPAYLTYMPVVLKLVQINTAVLQFVINIEQILFTGLELTAICKTSLINNTN